MQMQKLRIISTVDGESEDFDPSFIKECDLYKFYSNQEVIHLDFQIKAIQLMKRYFEFQLDQPTFFVKQPITSVNITEFIDQTSINFLDTLNYSKIMKPGKQREKKAPEEKFALDQDKKEKVQAWYEIIRELVDLVYFIGYQKLKDVLVVSVSVPLYLPIPQNAQDQNIETPVVEKEYKSVKFDQLITEQAKKEIQEIWNRVKTQPQGLGILNPGANQDAVNKLLEEEEGQEETYEYIDFQ